MPKEHTRLYKAIEALSIPKNIKQRALFRISELEKSSDYYRVLSQSDIIDKEKIPESLNLKSAITWYKTPEGHDFWQGIHNHLEIAEDKASKKQPKGEIYG